jgi:hypothetical protein
VLAEETPGEVSESRADFEVVDFTAACESGGWNLREEGRGEVGAFSADSNSGQRELRDGPRDSPAAF